MDVRPPEAAATLPPAEARGEGWRPGARWARNSGDRVREKQAVVDAIATLPAHQRPPMRELGRRSEAAPVPFRAMPRDEAGGLRQGWVPPMVGRDGGFTAADGAAGLPGAWVQTRANIVPSPTSYERSTVNRMVAGSNPAAARGARAQASSAGVMTGPAVCEKTGEGGGTFSTPSRRGESSATVPGAASNVVAMFDVREGWREGGIAERQRAGGTATANRKGGGKPVAARPGYDREGAFWQTGRELGGVVKRATRAEPSKARDVGATDGSAPVPLVLSVRDGARVVVGHACPAARALGIRVGMAMTMARAMVPGLDVRDADPAGVAADLDRLALFALKRWTPGVAVSDADGLWIDLSGVAHLHGGEARFCRRVLRFCARLGFTARIAVAGTAGAAHALARFGRVAAPMLEGGAEAEALAPLPIDALRIDAAACERLRRLGVETVGDLIAMPRAPLNRRFGGTVLRRLDQALGRMAEPIVPVVAQAVPAARLRLVEPIATADAIAQVIGDLLALLVVELAARGLGARRLELRCERVDGQALIVRAGTARPNRDAAHLARLLVPKIETIDPGFGIDAMAIHAVASEPLGATAITTIGEDAAADLAILVDLVTGRVGTHRLFRMGAVESDVPERAHARAAPLSPPAAWPAAWPRPVRLLDPPQRLDHVTALLPDHAPRRFSCRGHVHDVAHGDGPERIYGEWWRRAGEADAVRDYFQVEDASGARYWIFRRGDGVDGRTGDMSWHLHGVFA